MKKSNIVQSILLTIALAISLFALATVVGHQEIVQAAGGGASPDGVPCQGNCGYYQSWAYCQYGWSYQGECSTPGEHQYKAEKWRQVSCTNGRYLEFNTGLWLCSVSYPDLIYPLCSPTCS